MRRDKKAVSWREPVKGSEVEWVRKAARIIENKNDRNDVSRACKIPPWTPFSCLHEKGVRIYTPLSQHEFYTGYNVRACNQFYVLANE